MDGLTVAREEEVVALLPFKVGDAYLPATLETGLETLRRWGLFTDVRATTASRPDGIAIRLHFAEARLIGEINIRGNYPFVQRRVRRYLTIRPGDPYQREEIERQVERLQDFYLREGYRDTKIEVHEEWQPHTSDMRVDFHIFKGTVYTIGRVTVRGNTLFPRGRFISALNPWRLYTPRRLREATARLTALYRRRGYPKARIRVAEETLNPRFNEIDVTLDVEEGPYVTVRFMGNTKVSVHDCRKALTLFTEGRTDEFELETSAERIRKLYEARGFPDAEVTFDRELVNEREMVYLFSIVEGTQQRIRRVTFEGNAALGRDTLQRQMLTKPISFFHRGTLDPALLKEDANVLAHHYRSAGYLDARVDPPAVVPTADHHFLDIIVPIHEGEHYRVGEVRFTGNLHATHDALTQAGKLRPGVPANLSDLAADKEAIRLYLVDHGYPYAQIEQAVLRDDAAHTVTVAYTITEGPAVRIGEVLIVGDFITSQRAIRRAMTVKPGDLYSEQRILASQLGIRRLGAFRSVTIETMGLKEGATVVPLKVRVEEEKPFVVDIDLGYSTDRHVTGTLNFTNLNSFGWAKRTQFRLTGGRQLSRAEIGWIDPRFLARDLTWTTNTWIQYENKIAFNYLQAGGGFGLYRQFHRTGFQARYNLERNYFLGGDSVAADVESLRDNVLSTIGLGASFDTRNNFSDPTSGIYLSGGADLLNEIKGAHANFVHLHGGISHYWKLFAGLTLAQYGRLAGLQPMGDNVSVPSNKLLFMGGDDTIRGFAEDSLGPLSAAGRATGGRVRWIYNAELTAPLFQGLKGAIFFDIGSLTNAFHEINSATIRDSLGLGLRYMTPVGPIRADYGFKLDRAPGEGTGRLHFTFGHIF